MRVFEGFSRIKSGLFCPPIHPVSATDVPTYGRHQKTKKDFSKLCFVPSSSSSSSSSLLSSSPEQQVLLDLVVRRIATYTYYNLNYISVLLPLKFEPIKFVLRDKSDAAAANFASLRATILRNGS